jgi:ribosomal protein S1
MLCNESEETLRPGQVVACEIYKVEDKFAKGRLSSGLDGYILSSRFPRRFQLKERDVIQALVIKLDVDRVQVDLDATEESIDKNWMVKLGQSLRDQFFSNDRELNDQEKAPCTYMHLS